MSNDLCPSCCPDETLLEKSNCTQKLPQVKLDPTTRAGASCARCGKTLPQEEVPLFINEYFSPSE